MKNKIKYILIGVLMFMCSINTVFADTVSNVNLNNEKVVATFAENKVEELPSCEVLINEELRGLLNKYMSWIRVLVPVALIALCMVDLGKAVIAGKEDEMKKAQSTLIKRLIMGLVIFLVPTIVNFTIDFADKYFDTNIFKNGTCGIE